MPFYRTLISMVSWCIGGVVFIVASWPMARHAAPVVGVAIALGAAATAIIGYLQSERVLAAGSRCGAARRCARERQGAGRHPAADAGLDAVDRRCRYWRSCWRWWPTRFRCCMPRRRSCSTRSCCWRWRHWRSGWPAPCWWPCRSPTRCASCAGRCARCSAATTTPTCRSTTPASWACCRPASTTWSATCPSGSGCATCSAATSAKTSPAGRWSAAPSWAGRSATSRCCSSTWSARPSWPRRRPPGEVVSLLNEFFRVVVDTVGRHGGFVNKFQGDAALAIFGAPIEHPDASGGALAAARDLHDELLAGARLGRVRHRGVGREGHRRPHRRPGPLRVHRDRRPGQRGRPAHRAGQAGGRPRAGVGDRGQRRPGRRSAVLGRRRGRRAARPDRPDATGAAAEPG